jgi:hypothetical protein
MPKGCTYRKGVYWIDEYRDIHQYVKVVRQERSKIFRFGSYGLPYFRRHVFSVFDRHDIKPFLKRGIGLLKRGLQEIVGRVNLKRGYAHEK